MKKYCYILLFLFLNLNCLGQAEYVCTTTGVYRVDFANCSSQQISTANFLTDIAVLPNGELYGIDFYKLYHINTANGIMTFVADIDSPGTGFNSLTALDNDRLLAINVTTKAYYIEVSTGSKTEIGYLNYSPSGDVTRFKGKYFMTDSGDRLIRFELDTTSNIIYQITNVGFMNSPSSSVYGIFTSGNVSCTFDSLSLVAFEEHSVYTVDENNADFTFYCDLNVGTITGAASIIESQQQLLTSSLEMPNVFTPNCDGLNDFFTIPDSKNFLTNHRLIVTNRWGQTMFESEGEGAFSWDGITMEGERSIEGIYYFQLVYSDFCGTENNVTGFFHLLR